MEFGADGVLDHRTPNSTNGVEHRHSLLGMPAGATVSLRPVLVDDDGDEVVGPVSAIQLAPAPLNLPRFSLEVSDPSAEMNGRYLLTTVFAQDTVWIVIVNDQGEPVWYVEPSDEGGVTGATVAGDGSGILWIVGTIGVGITAETSTVLSSLDGSHYQVFETPYAHHAVVSDANGLITWLSYVSDELPLAGQVATVYSDALSRINSDGEEQTPLFNFLADYPDEPEKVCEHVTMPFGGGFEWTHTNSLVFDKGSDAYFVLSRYLDTVLKISADSGALLWQFGGQGGQFEGLDTDERFDHAHMSWINGDTLLVFDNRTHSLDGESRVVEYTLDQATMTAELTWSYPDPEGRLMNLLGDARGLPGDDILVIWSEVGEFEEVTREHQVRWRISTTGGHSVSRGTVIDDLYTLAEAI